MPYTYTSAEDGQVIHSDVPRDDLDKLARWERTGEADSTEATGGDLTPKLDVSSPSGTPEQSLSGGPYPPDGVPNWQTTVNVPPPSEVIGDAAKVYPTAPSKFFDGGDGRHVPTPVDLLGVPPTKIVNQGGDSGDRANLNLYPTEDQEPIGVDQAGVLRQAEAVPPSAPLAPPPIPADIADGTVTDVEAYTSETNPGEPNDAPEVPEAIVPSGTEDAPEADEPPADPPAPVEDVKPEDAGIEGYESGDHSQPAAPADPGEGDADEHEDAQGNPDVQRPAGNASTDAWLDAYRAKAGRDFPFDPDVDGDKPKREDVITAFDALSEGGND